MSSSSVLHNKLPNLHQTEVKATEITRDGTVKHNVAAVEFVPPLIV